MKRLLAATAFILPLAAYAPAVSAQSAPPIPSIASLTALGTVQQSPYVVLRDGTYSTGINGASYWSFNDTGMNASNSAGNSFIDNSLAWATSLNASGGIALNGNQVGVNGVPIRFIPFTSAEQQFQHTHDPAHCTATPASACGESLALWGGGIAYDPASGQVIQVFGEEVRGGHIRGFHQVGAGFAVGRVLKNGDIRFTRPIQNPGQQHPTLMWGPHDQPFADQILIYNGDLYAYSTRTDGLTLHVLVGRVPLAQFLTKSAWTYYAGNGVWSTNVNDAVGVFDGGSAGSSVFYDAWLKEWVTIYTGVLSNSLYYRVGAAPEGPWSAQALLFNGAPGYNGTVDYSGKAHPEFSPDNGRTIYVTYVHSPGNVQQDLPLTQVVFGPPQ